jgi:3-methyladenine DNA glycosylase AlkC
MPDAESEIAPALKEIFDAARMRHIATETAAVFPGFDTKRFLAFVLADLDSLSIMQRLRRVAEGFHATLPADYRQALGVLRELAPRLNHSFVTMALPEYAALYGAGDVPASMDALKFFTRFGSSEYAVRHFLQRDLEGTLAVMKRWSTDKNEHVRRLASEGSRPRLPWSFQIKPLMADPSPLAPIFENLKDDPSLYVRRSVANSLNDITKDNPEWALERIEGWSLDSPGTAWIAKHALRSLVKKGDRRALAVMGAGEAAEVELRGLKVSPKAIQLGESIALSLALHSTSSKSQRLVVDYGIHYVKKSGGTAVKVFKLKTFTLAPHAVEQLSRSQSIKNFTTRVHYAGRHEVEVFVNGQPCGRTAFTLST